MIDLQYVSRRTSAFFLIAFLVAAFGPAPATAGIKIGGTGGDLGTWQKIADAYRAHHPEVEITVLPSLGSGGGIKALAAGAIDLSISSRPLKEKERADGLREFPYAKTPLALSSANGLTLDDLTTEDLLEIYGKGTHQWPDGKPVLVILRPQNDTDVKLVTELFPAMTEAFIAAETRGARIAASDQDAADALQETEAAVAFMSVSLIQGEGRSLNTFALNGVAPTVENLYNGSYPIVKTYYLMTGAKTDPAAEALIDFLTSPEGKEILRSTGHMSLDPS